MRARLAAPNRHQVYSTPAVAMDVTTRKIVARWEAGGNSHWVVGAIKEIDGVFYKLESIEETHNLFYLLCRRK